MGATKILILWRVVRVNSTCSPVQYGVINIILVFDVIILDTILVVSDYVSHFIRVKCKNQR